MKQFVVTVTTNGRITIPVDVRRHLGISAHDKIAFATDGDGSVRIEPVPFSSVDTLREAAGSLAHPMSWDEMIRIAYEDRHIIERKLSH